MIRFVEILLSMPSHEITTKAHEELNELLSAGWKIIGHSTYQETESDVLLNYERFTLHNPDGTGVALRSDDLILTGIVQAERGETSNSNSPMWRCMTEDQHAVNVFQHEDPQKDTFRLFEKCGWGDELLAIPLYRTKIFESPIQIAMRKKGKWWEVVAVSRASVSVNDVQKGGV